MTQDADAEQRGESGESQISPIRLRKLTHIEKPDVSEQFFVGLACWWLMGLGPLGLIAGYMLNRLMFGKEYAKNWAIGMAFLMLIIAVVVGIGIVILWQLTD